MGVESGDIPLCEAEGCELAVTGRTLISVGGGRHAQPHMDAKNPPPEKPSFVCRLVGMAGYVEVR